MCSRCDDLEEQVAWLRSELGLQRDLATENRLCETIPRGAHAGRPQLARFVMALYAAKGRPVTRFQLLEACPPTTADEDSRSEKILDVWVWRARGWLGRDAVLTLHGKGYRLSESGMAKVAALLGDDQRAAA